MNNLEPDAPTNPEPVGEPNCVTESLNSVDIVIDVPRNTTGRPRPSNVPRSWPAGVPLPDPSPPPSKPDEPKKS